MIRLVGSELLKLRTTRTFWATVGSTFGLLLLLVVLSLALSDNFRTEDEVRSLLSSASLSGLLVLVFLFVIDPVITAVAEGYAKFSLTGLGTSMSGGSAEDVQGSDLLPFGVAALIWAAYTVALAVAASVLTTRRDI